jgi:hypothetical protein
MNKETALKQVFVDKSITNALILQTLKVPLYSNLPAVNGGDVGNVLFNKFDNTFYGSDGINWIPLGGSGSVNLQTAYNNSLTSPQIQVNNSNGTLVIQGNLAVNPLQLTNNSGNNMFSVDGTGLQGRIAIGNISSATAQSAIAIGENATASATSSIALGSGQINNVPNSVLIGPASDSFGNPGYIIHADNVALNGRGIVDGRNGVIFDSTLTNNLPLELRPGRTYVFSLGFDVGAFGVFLTPSLLYPNAGETTFSSLTLRDTWTCYLINDTFNLITLNSPAPGIAYSGPGSILANSMLIVKCMYDSTVPPAPGSVPTRAWGFTV